MPLFAGVKTREKNETIEKLLNNGSPSRDFFLMVSLSVLMATFGLLLNSVAVIIGSMLIAPILYPILSVSMAVVMCDYKLLRHSIYTIAKAVGLAIIASTIVAIFFSQENILDKNIILETKPSLIYIAIAFIAGTAASFAMVKPQLNETLPGIAISVALIPPLSVVGIGIASFNWVIISNAALLFFINIAGIIFASMVVFSLMNFYVKRDTAEKILKREKEELEQEKKNGQSQE